MAIRISISSAVRQIYAMGAADWRKRRKRQTYRTCQQWTSCCIFFISTTHNLPAGCGRSLSVLSAALRVSVKPTVPANNELLAVSFSSQRHKTYPQVAGGLCLCYFEVIVLRCFGCPCPQSLASRLMRTFFSLFFPHEDVNFRLNHAVLLVHYFLCIKEKLYVHITN